MPPAPPTSACGRAGEYLAAGLSADEETRFLAHAATCARCQADLNDDVQLAALEAEARKDHEGGRVVPLAPRRLRRAAWLAVPAALAAAAALILVLRGDRGDGGGGKPTPPGPALALADTRGLEPRLTWAPADGYRPYAVARGGGGVPDVSEPIAPETIAALGRAGDQHGVAAAWLLSGDARRARAALDAAGAPGTSPDLDSDRAAAALVAGDPEAALRLADGVLVHHPLHPQARWNRGLALRELGAPFAAAADFAAVAQHDPAWAGEAGQRAAALRAEIDDRRQAWTAMNEAGFAMLAGGPVLGAELARRFPGSARRFLYDALRLAPSAERVDELRPLALELDRVYGGAVLAGWVERARRHAFARRAGVAADYLRLARGQLPAAEHDAFLRRAAAAGDDLHMGALVLTRRAGAADGRFARWAAATGDPWFELLALDAQAQAAFAAGDATRAESAWLAARARCRGQDARQAYRCGLVESGLADLYTAHHRYLDARAAADAAFALAHGSGEWGLEAGVQMKRANLAFFQERWPLARALLDEVRLSGPDDCASRRWQDWMTAQVLIFERRPADAAAWARRAPTCPDGAWSNTELQALIDLARFGQPVLDLAAARAIIAGRRAGAAPPDRAFLDYAEGRLIIDGDRAAGERLLEAALAATAGSADEIARTTARLAATTLAVDAARSGDWAAFFARLAHFGAPPGERCVLGAAIDDDRAAVAVRGADGRVLGRYQADRRDPALATLVPPDLLAALGGCSTIAVHASPLVVGHPELLPLELPWGFRLAQAKATPAPAAGLPARRLVVLDPRPPAALGLPALAPGAPPAGAVVVRGAEAHPERVVLEMEDATEIELHAHGLVDLARSSAPLLALSPGPSGDWAFTVELLAARKLRGAPVVALADCGAAGLSQHEAWGLPTALLAAGARAVLASPTEITDADAASFFADVLDGVRHGEPPAAALAAARRAWIDRAPWVRDVMLFE